MEFRGGWTFRDWFTFSHRSIVTRRGLWMFDKFQKHGQLKQVVTDPLGWVCNLILVVVCSCLRAVTKEQSFPFWHVEDKLCVVFFLTTLSKWSTSSSSNWLLPLLWHNLLPSSASLLVSIDHILYFCFLLFIHQPKPVCLLPHHILKLPCLSEQHCRNSPVPSPSWSDLSYRLPCLSGSFFHWFSGQSSWGIFFFKHWVVWDSGWFSSVFSPAYTSSFG